MTKTVFLSSVTAEFGGIRQRLASLMQRTKKCQVRHQEDFFHRGVKTLKKLFEEVAESDLVVHLIGSQSGWRVPADQANDLLGEHPEFEAKYPEVAELARQGNLPATQWEAWLGLYLGKRLCSFNLNSAVLDPSQEGHLDRLNKLEEHPDSVRDLESLYDEVIGTLITLNIVTNEDIRRPIHLPFPSLGALFKGREEAIEKLRNSYDGAQANSALAIAGKAVHGLGGVGKTRLAVEYAWRFAEEYSAVLCVTADSRANLRRNLAGLAGPMILDLQEHDAADEELRAVASLRWLERHPGWLLILDNVDTDEAAEAVGELLSKLQGGQVLITSRLSRISDSIETIELDIVSPEDGAEFMLAKTAQRGRRGRKVTDTDDVDALELARELGGLALAMDQAAAYIAQLRYSFQDYLILWRSNEEDVLDWLSSTVQYAGPTDSPPRSMAVTWQTTIDQLGEPERELLDMLAWLAPDPVPLFALERLFQHSPSADHPKLFKALGLTQSSFREALANLADFSMLAWDVATDTVVLHRVVQEVLRNRQEEPDKNLQIVLYLLTALANEHNPLNSHAWPKWEELRAHVAFSSKMAVDRKIANPTEFLLNHLGNYLAAQASHSEAEAAFRTAISLNVGQHGKDNVTVATYHNNLSAALHEMDRLDEALETAEEGLRISEEIEGVESVENAANLNNLAAIKKSLGRYDEAEALFRRAIDLLEGAKGKEDALANTLSNLASLLSFVGQYREAESLQSRALELFREAHGETHERYSVALTNLAQIQKATNRLDEAEINMQKALQTDEAIFGTSHPRVALTRLNLGQLYRQRKQLTEAEQLLRTAWESLGESDPAGSKYAMATGVLAAHMHDANRFEEAEELYKRQIELVKTLTGPSSSREAEAIAGLGKLYSESDRLAEAERMLKDSLAILIKKLGKQNLKVANVQVSLAECLARRNSRQRAVKKNVFHALDAYVSFNKNNSRTHVHFAQILSRCKNAMLTAGIDQHEVESLINKASRDSS